MKLSKSILFGLPLMALMGLSSCSRDKDYSCLIPNPEPENPGVECIPDAKPSLRVEADGFYMVNEGWFGHDGGSVNFFGKDGHIAYRAYSTANAGEEFGKTTAGGVMYGDNLYFTSKQGNRLVVADAKTLKKKAVLEEVGGDARFFQGINANKGYLSVSSGISILNLEDFTYTGKQIAGVSGEVGDMCQVNNTVFAAGKGKIYAIHAEKDELIETIEVKGANSVLLAKDGNVWAGAGETLYKINPATFEVEKRDIKGLGIRTNPWAWTPRAIDASATSNTLYWASGKSVIKYDIESGSSESIFTLGSEDGKNLGFYGAGLRVDPLTEDIAVIGQQGFSTFIWVYLIDNAGKEIKKYQVLNQDGKEHYWFPSMPLFLDMNKPEILVNQILVPVKETVEIDLSEKVVDADTFDAAISKVVEVKEGETLISASIENNKLIVEGLGEEGKTEITLTVNSNGCIVSKTIEVVIAEELTCKL